MKIMSYLYKDVDETKWKYSKIDFGKINLLVGGTASGKSRLLNTIFSLGRFAVTKEFKSGSWDVTFEQGANSYRWILESRTSDEGNIVVVDKIYDVTQSREVQIVDRDQSKFYFNNKELPKLSKDETSVKLLMEEELIAPIYSGFASIRKRNFDLDALSMSCRIEAIPLQLIKDIEKKKDIKIVRHHDLSINAVMYLLQNYFPAYYSEICNYYKSVFPFIIDISVQHISQLNDKIEIPGKVPVFCIKERNVNEWISLDQLSSGMKKVLLILTDIYLLPEGGIYLIDEYENSLGINAIEFLPTFLLDLEKNIQFFITSHHPYIINKIPVNNWYVFHRNGSEIIIKYGDELISRLGKSKQAAFIKLINDPFYIKGTE